MSHLGITMNLDEAPWLDLKEEAIQDGLITRIGLLPDGMASGKPSVAMVVEIDGGGYVIAQMSWQMLKQAVHAFEVSPVVAEFDKE